MEMPMTLSRPYLIRAIYEWLLDNQMTPYLLVNADAEGADVPRQFVENGKIVLNISPQAVENLVLGNDLVSFSARFSGKPMQVFVPVFAALAMYARENGRGMVFAEEPDAEPPPPPERGDNAASAPKTGRPKLSVIK